jgi:hypothetical protein
MDIKEILAHIPPSDLTYDEWLSVGMALKHEGFTAEDWDEWSRADSRYKSGECAAKWDGLDRADPPVTAGTIVQLAKERGLTFGKKFTAFDWDDCISFEENNVPAEIIVKSDEGEKIRPPADFDPVTQIVKFIETVFKPDEYVGYVTEVYEHDGILSPTRGNYDRTAGTLIEALKNCRVPVIFFHGEADDFVPCDMSRRMQAVCPTRSALVTVPGAGHGLAYPMDKPSYIQALGDFFGPEASAK